MGSTRPMWVGLDLCDGSGWVEFFLTYHGRLGQKIPSTRLMHTPINNIILSPTYSLSSDSPSSLFFISLHRPFLFSFYFSLLRSPLFSLFSLILSNLSLLICGGVLMVELGIDGGRFSGGFCL